MVASILSTPQPVGNPVERSKVVIVIPARMESKRLPGKPLLEAGGLTLLEWTYQRAKGTCADYVIVTSPDRCICQHCQDSGIPWRPSGNKPTGTHRVAEVARAFKPDSGVGLVLNWQVDEPLVPAKAVDLMIRLHRDGRSAIGTLVCSSLVDDRQEANPHVTKVAMSNGKCHWFSRAPMASAYCHVGVYAFSIDTLVQVGNLPLSKYSIAEGLEQLAWIEAGFQVTSTVISELPLSVNTPEDFAKFREMMEC